MPVRAGDNGVSLSQVGVGKIVGTCLYGQFKEWPSDYGVGVSIPSGGTYGNIYLCVYNAGSGVGDVRIGLGQPNDVNWVKLKTESV